MILANTAYIPNYNNQFLLLLLLAYVFQLDIVRHHG
jgi:hypothetical protein